MESTTSVKSCSQEGVYDGELEVATTCPVLLVAQSWKERLECVSLSSRVPGALDSMQPQTSYPQPSTHM
jgi:hypothetical protein